jgi:hypothetical protein
MIGQGVKNQFQDMKTKTKLLVSFGLVSVIIMIMASVGVFTLRQLSTQSQTVYADYTVPLAEFAQMGTALTKHHQILLDVASATKQADFAQEVTKLPPLKAQIDKVVNNYKSTTLRVSRSGRDEAKDLTLFEPALKKYFQDADGALSAMADSFDRNVLSSTQAEQMRALGILALTVNLTPSFENAVKRHNEQVTAIEAVAKDLNDDAQGSGQQRYPDSGGRRSGRRGPRIVRRISAGDIPLPEHQPHRQCRDAGRRRQSTGSRENSVTR